MTNRRFQVPTLVVLVLAVLAPTSAAWAQGTFGTLPDPATTRLLRMGQILNFNKVYMARAYEDSQLQFELYNLFGDPSMKLRIPETLNDDIHKSVPN